MKKYRILFYFIAFFVFLRSPLRAEPVLPHLFSDHMVIRRETEIRIWGWADAGEKISVSFGAGSGQAITNADGRWRVTQIFSPASAQPQIRISVSRRIT